MGGALVQTGVLYKRVASDVAVTTAGSPGLLYGVILIGGTTASKIQLKDGTTSGGVACELTVKAQTVAGDDMKEFSPTDPVVFSSDIFADITGTGAIAYVYYKEL